jgi:hypothetical protein
MWYTMSLGEHESYFWSNVGLSLGCDEDSLPLSVRRWLSDADFFRRVCENVVRES